MAVGVVVNPVAGGGRLKQEWVAISEALTRHFGSFELAETAGAGEACGLARGMGLRGIGLVIAAGGDGTASEVADGLLQAFDESGARSELAVLPCGTRHRLCERARTVRRFR